MKNLIGEECWVYMDDVVVYYKTEQENLQMRRNMLQGFDKANLQLQPEKCVFARSQIQYFGFVLSERGVAASPDKVKAVKNCPTPEV